MMANKEMMRERQEKLSHNRLTEVLSYDPITGIFLWKKRISIRIVVGKVAGVPDKHGHRLIRIDNIRWAAHRLAWFYIYGIWPEDQIEHRDLNKDNNAILNLREANQAQNMCNTPKPITNTSGYKGVTFHSFAADGRKRWLAQIQHHKKNYSLGLFDDPQTAHKAYIAASKEKHGEFGRVA